MIFSNMSKSKFPIFDVLEPEELQLVENNSYTQSMKKGMSLVESGSICHNVYFVVTGRIRVYKTLPDGKEITLYRVVDGEMCLFSMSCILEHSPLDAIAEIEKDSTILVVPEDSFNELLNANQRFQRLIMTRLLSALSEVLLLLEEVTFHSMNKRVANYLISKNSNLLKLTHEDIALELGTAREVVSRLLKEFEKKGLLSLSRGKIKIIDRNNLEDIALS
jgi:CRP/FNR family transcriptional regulator